MSWKVSLVPHVPFHTKYPSQTAVPCNLWFCATHNMGGLATPYNNHQQHTNTMSTANYSVSKYRNQAQKLEEKQSCGAHQTDNGRVGWDHQIHTSRLPRMIRNHMYTRLYQAPYQLCLTTSLLATVGISHEGPRFFTLVQLWRTSIYLFFLVILLCHTQTHRNPTIVFVASWSTAWRGNVVFIITRLALGTCCPKQCLPFCAFSWVFYRPLEVCMKRKVLMKNLLWTAGYDEYGIHCDEQDILWTIFKDNRGSIAI